MYLKTFIENIEDKFPKSLAADWDNVGLLCGRLQKQITNVYVALDATEYVIADAIKKNTDLLITHHPLIFKPVSTITNADFIGRRLISLITSDIAYYAIHTNYDVTNMRIIAAKMLGIKNPVVLDEQGFPDDSSDDENPGIKGFGAFGEVNETTLEEYAKSVKNRFGLSNVRFFGNPRQKITRVAIGPGSGESMIKAAISKKADVIITGDVSHHAGIDAVASGTAVIDAGHYGIEQIFVNDIKSFMKRTFPELTVYAAPKGEPFITI
ncbi:MAG: Nif3-like dinuclear metal center hexameric protein [Lachnospiraceae bacterium]|jgi:dinuclear metal center YbgI/SA1388 family protein|nr:Nif3-like dinuclear metal center hexameric protein [Lachnospiraceae bacterium]